MSYEELGDDLISYSNSLEKYIISFHRSSLGHKNVHFLRFFRNPIFKEMVYHMYF